MVSLTRSLRLVILNSCSIGLSCGEYSALKSAVTLNLSRVFYTIGLLWKLTLSNNKTIGILLVSGVYLNFNKSSYRKFSKTILSVVPSII